MMQDETVVTRFESLGLKPEELELLFGLMSKDNDGVAEYEELLENAIRLKGGARAIDTIVLQHNQKKMMHLMGQIYGEMARRPRPPMPGNSHHLGASTTPCSVVVWHARRVSANVRR